MDDRWQLARWVRSADDGVVTITPIRDVDRDESSRIMTAARVVATMTGNKLIKPLVDATNVLGQVAGHVLERPGMRANDAELRSTWSAALDVWLMHVVMMRRRTEREVGRLLGDAAHRHARDVFEALYRTDPDFRLAWEWRNIAQHDMDPLELTRVTVGVGEDSAPQVRWVIDPEAAGRQHQFGNEVCASRVVETPECYDVIAAVVRSMEAALSKIVLFAEDTIADAAGLIFARVGEVLNTVDPRERDGNRQVSAVVASLGSPESILYAPLRYDLAAHALLTLDAARESVGLPRVHTPPPDEHTGAPD